MKTTAITTITSSPIKRIHPWTGTIQNMRVVKQRELLPGSGDEENTNSISLKPNMSSPDLNKANKTGLTTEEPVFDSRHSTSPMLHSQQSIPREVSTTITLQIKQHKHKTTTAPFAPTEKQADEEDHGARYFTFETQEMNTMSKNGERQFDNNKTTHHCQSQQLPHPSKQSTKLKTKKRSSENDISAKLMHGPRRCLVGRPSPVDRNKMERLPKIDNTDSTNQCLYSPSCPTLVVYDIADQRNGVPRFIVRGRKQHDARTDHLFFPPAQEGIQSVSMSTSKSRIDETGTGTNTEMSAANKKKSVHWDRVNLFVYHSLDTDDSEEEEDEAGDGNDDAKTSPTTILVKPKMAKSQVVVLRSKVRALPIKSSIFNSNNNNNLPSSFRRRRQKLSFLDRFMQERQAEMKKKHQQEDPRLREANEKWAESYGRKK
jgi:hypothetical protein